MTAQAQNKRRLRGIVVSDLADKTVVVLVERFRKQTKYKKYMKQSKRYKAHDEANTCKKGDVVVIEETRPISKDKHFRVLHDTNTRMRTNDTKAN